ncbi:translation initiation factor IF-2 [Streptomyces malaysiensis]|uniref:Translation initiation factor IF-2 n=1 Tax=Streptomyces malaysiensis TaxID=92644 RepID=A0A7X5X756_STRMQ|nr:translation initiation factor IF-2 [Streptomyces malaysiensis]
MDRPRWRSTRCRSERGGSAPSGGRAGVPWAVNRTRWPSIDHDGAPPPSIGSASTGRRPPDCAGLARPSPPSGGRVQAGRPGIAAPPRKRGRADPSAAGGRSGRPAAPDRAAPDQPRPRSADRRRAAAVRGGPKGARGVGPAGHDGAAPRTIDGRSGHFQRSAYARCAM